MFSIGEFSRITQLSIKTLRYYHDIGLLEPGRIDETTGYRYYSNGSFDRVRIINALKEMGFTLKEILAIFSQCQNEKDIRYFIENKLDDINDKLKELQTYKKRLAYFKELIEDEQRREIDVKESFVAPFLLAGIRMQGKYDKISEGFYQFIKQLGGLVRGKPCCLHFDLEYKEEDADFMPCFEVKKAVTYKGISCFTLEPGKRFP